MSGWRTIEDALTLGHGTERSFCCPVHVDTNPSASVNALSGLWVCYTCGASGRVDLEKFTISIDSVVREVKRVAELFETPTHERYSERWLDIFDAGGPGEYWLSRFSPEACSRFRLGVDLTGQWAVYPFYDAAGRVMGVVRRALGGGAKYKYPFGSDTSKNLFNYHRCEGDDIVLVEGATDAIAAWEAGVQAMALYGAQLHRAQKILLNKYSPKRIWVATDMDPAGHQLALAIEHAFPHVDVRRLRWEGYKDLSEMPLKIRTEVLAPVGMGRVASPACGSPETGASSRKPSLTSSRPVRIRKRPAVA